ncbi:MAG: hypothetical protein ACK4M4_02945 [Flavobacterium sp.]
MRKNYFPKRVLQIVFFLIVTVTTYAQVGIGTTTPHASSILDVTSTTQGMLTPRMTTAQRNAITSPADGLMVYDTDLRAFYYYNQATPAWTVINSASTGRLKFKRIRSTDVLSTVLASELAAGGGAKYVLDSGTYYEINGAISVNFPIDLNNAYLVGLDANEDLLIKSSGFLFEGSSGGTIKTLGIAGTSAVFNLVGSGNTQSFILRDAIVANSANVGTISGFGLVFLSFVNFAANTTGITYTNNTRVLLSNTAWFGNNAGTFERFTGAFSLIQKQGGFSEVNGAAVGVDVSANPSITGDAVMESVVFTGTLSTGKYVNGYTTGSYTGYNFDNNWNVRCAGIPTETDASATGNMYDPSNTSSTRTTATTQNVGYKVNTNVTTTDELLRVSSSTTGRLTYRGKKTRSFQVNSSVAFIETTVGTNAVYVFYFVKVGSNGSTITPLPATETYIDTNSGFTQAFPVSGSITLNQNESVELWLKRINTGTKINIDTFSFNMTLK